MGIMRKINEQTQKIFELYRYGFNQTEIAEILGLHQSTVSRRFQNPPKEKQEHFNENHAYGAYITKHGERILFNRRYKPLSDKKRFVKDIVKQEWFYNDGTSWADRFYNSQNEIVVYFVERKKRDDF